MKENMTPTQLLRTAAEEIRELHIGVMNYRAVIAAFQMSTAVALQKPELAPKYLWRDDSGEENNIAHQLEVLALKMESEAAE